MLMNSSILACIFICVSILCALSIEAFFVNYFVNYLQYIFSQVNTYTIEVSLLGYEDRKEDETKSISGF
jgi:hypothetical protein